MGVNLRNLVPKKQISLSDLSGSSFAIDAYNALYQFLAIIRQPDGTPLKDKTGKVTSHLSGILYRTANLIQMGIKVVYVFDGIPPILKKVEIKRRSERKKKALKRYKKALQEGKIEEARTYAQATSRLKDYMEEDSKRLLSLIGVPWIQAPSEGEAQAAYLTKKRDTNYCASQDYDSLLFGAPFLIRNVTISGRRKLPRKKLYVDVIPEIIELNQVLNKLQISLEQLIDVGILVGTDFNPDGVKGVGPKTALNLIKKHGCLEDALTYIKNAELPSEPQYIREIFLNPKITNNYHLKWREPDIDGTIQFLCHERDFSEERVKKAIEKIEVGIKETKGKVTLETYFQ